MAERNVIYVIHVIDIFGDSTPPTKLKRSKILSGIIEMCYVQMVDVPLPCSFLGGFKET